MVQLIWSWDDGEYSKGPRMVLTSSRDGLRSLLAARIPPQLWKETEAGKQTEQKPARLKYKHIDASGETSPAPALPPYTHTPSTGTRAFQIQLSELCDLHSEGATQTKPASVLVCVHSDAGLTRFSLASP